MIEMIVSVLVGGVITFFVSRHYYKRAGDDLRLEARSLHKQTQLILVSLEQAGLVVLTRDGEEVIGFKEWRIHAQGIPSSTEFGSATIANANVD
ncbi:MAG: hypothetical protein V4457_06580 [Pseudomonadota bacterium]|jgi:hypothetical protein